MKTLQAGGCRDCFWSAVGVWLLALWFVPWAGRGAEYLARTHTDGAGGSLPYRLLVPRGYDGGTAHPLVLFFHGAGERGMDNAAQLKHGTGRFTRPEVREQFPTFVVVPQCPAGEQWVDMPWGEGSGVQPAEPSAAMKLALGILDAVVAEFNIDTNRLYVTGLSMGGYATWDCLTRYPERFAAAVPICGGGDERTVTAGAARVPVWAFHSEDDGVVPVSRTRNMIAAMRAGGGSPIYFEYWDQGHGSWNRAYAEPELLSWLFAQRRGQPGRYVLKTAPPELPAVARFPADDAFPGAGPIRKWDWFRKLWRERRLEWWAARERDRGAVVFLGDSITQGWGTLAGDFPGLKVANRGISGDVTRGLLYRLQEDVLDLEPSAVVLLIGTNDLEDNGDPETIAANVRLLLERLKAQDADLPVVICRVMPSHETMRRPAEKIRELNARLDGLAASEANWQVCDTWSGFADAAGNADPAEFPDRLHPNAAGYAKWREVLAPILAGLELGEAARRQPGDAH